MPNVYVLATRLRLIKHQILYERKGLPNLKAVSNANKCINIQHKPRLTFVKRQNAPPMAKQLSPCRPVFSTTAQHPQRTCIRQAPSLPSGCAAAAARHRKQRRRERTDKLLSLKTKI